MSPRAELREKLWRAQERRGNHEARCTQCAEDRECLTLHALVDAVAKATAAIEDAKEKEASL